MSSLKRKLERNKKRRNGTLPKKKAIAKKYGISLAEVNRRFFNEKKEKEYGK